LEVQSNNEILILILGGTSVLLILAVAVGVMVVLYNRRIIQQRNEKIQNEIAFKERLIAAALQSEEKERKEIAKNLHDELGALLSLIRLNQSKIAKGLDPDKLNSVLDQNKDLLGNVADIIRGTTNKLYSPILDKFGLVKAFKEFCRMIAQTGEIDVEAVFPDEEIKLTKDQEVQLYRVCLEVMNNIVKHANATSIVLRLSLKDSLEILYTYDGIGLSQEEFEALLQEERKGLGLKSIINRVQTLKGSILYGKSDEEQQQPNTVNIKIPTS